MDLPPSDITAPPFVMHSASTFPTQGAGFGIRFLARAIDVALTFVLSLVTGFMAGLIMAILAQYGKAPEDWLEKLESGPSLLIGILAAFIYQIISEAIGSASLGKVICGLRVVRADGAPCTFLGALQRGIAYHFDALFFGLVGYQSMKTTDLRQRYGDKWGHTVVVKVAEFAPHPPRKWWHITLGILTGTAAWVTIIGGDMWVHVFR